LIYTGMIVVLVCFLAHLQKNVVYRESGKVAKTMVEDILNAATSKTKSSNIVLVTMPREYGGAYLYHRSDLKFALKKIGKIRPDLEYFMKTYTVDDYASEYKTLTSDTFLYRVKYRTQAAFRKAQYNEKGDGRYKKRHFDLEVLEVDNTERVVTFKIIVSETILMEKNYFIFGLNKGKLYPIQLEKNASEKNHDLKQS